MTTPFKIAVIGGTGKSGTYLVEELLRRSFSLRLLLRRPHPVTNVETVLGNVTEPDALYRLLSGCDAVVSTLGLGQPPSEPIIFSQSTRHVLQAMQETGIRRYVLTTGLNVDTPGDIKSQATAAGTAWMQRTFPVSTADKQLEYKLLTESSADWTLIRLPLIELTDAAPPVVASLHDCPGDAVSVTSLARFLADQLVDSVFVRQAPFLANA